MTEKIIFTVIEAVLLLGAALFIFTAVSASLNAGNISGIVLCGAAFLLCLFRHEFIQFILRLRHGKGKIFLIAALILCLAALSIVGYISVRILSCIDRQSDEDLPVIVLGCQVKGDHPSVMLRQRINAAYGYLSEHPSSVCIASGGQGSGEVMSEAQCIKDELVKLGISPSRIIMEDKSVSTETNFEYSAEIMDRMNIPRRAVVVTSDYHQYRSSLIARKHGFETYQTSARTSRAYFPTYFLREIIAVIYLYVFG